MRRSWVVLVLIALLPLRGWAAASMAAPVWVVDGAVEAAGAALPCHAEAALDDLSASADDPATSSHLCHSCDLCHAGLAVAAHGDAALAHAPSVAPPPAHPRDTGRLLAGSLERPPRA